MPLLLSIALLFVTGLLGCPGALPGMSGDGDGDSLNVEGDPLSCGADCFNANVSCDPDGILVADGLRCADCEAGQICGSAINADCVEREDALGEPCQHCRTADGTVVYSDCAVRSENDVTCEPVPAVNEGDTCVACFDAAGVVVSAECRPESDECHVEQRSGGECEVCTKDGEVVFQACDAINIDPTTCVIYGDGSGQCTDCSDGAGQLVLHACSTGESDTLCSTFTTVDDQDCTVCSDNMGIVTSTQCGPALASPFFCEELLFSEQTCNVCVGEAGNLVSSQCARNDCDDPGVSCPPPPPCDSFVNDDGQLCRTCTLESEPGQTETRCLGERASGLMCNVVQQPLSDGNDFVGEEDCLECDYDGDRFYSICESEGPLEAPFCSTGVNGEACAECFDPLDGRLIYSTCAGEVCENVVEPDGTVCEICRDASTGTVVSESCEQCLREDNLNPLGPNGEPIGIDAANPALYACVGCTSEVGLPETQCRLMQTCEGVATGDDPFASPVCPDVLVWARAVTYCDEPWGEQWPPGIERTLAAVGWLADLGVTPRAAAFAQLDEPGCASCGCPSGETLYAVTLSDEEEVTLVELGFEYTGNAPP